MALIYCALPSGLYLDLIEQGIRKERVTLTNGITEVDGTFWTEWLKAHADSPLLTERAVFEVPSEPVPEVVAEPVVASKADIKPEPEPAPEKDA